MARAYAELFGALVLLGVALGLMLPGNLAALSLRIGPGAQGKAAGFNVVGQGLGLAIAFALAVGASRRRGSPATGETV